MFRINGIFFQQIQIKHLKAKYYVEVKEKKNILHPIKKNILRLSELSKSLKTQNQVQNETQTKKSQNYIGKYNNQLEVKNYPKTNNY